MSRPAQTPALAPAGSRATLGVLIALVSLVVLGTFWPVLSAQAVSLDDGAYLFDNPVLRYPSWSSVRLVFVEVLHSSTVEGYYEPLTLVSLMLDVVLGGRSDNLTAFHVTSLTLHLLNTALVVLLIYAIFGQPWVAAIVGLFFGLHPLTVEPVAWVWERKTLLATFFGLLCLILYVGHTRSGSKISYAGALLAFVLGLLSKPTLTPMPVLLLLLDFWPLCRLSWRAVLLKVPFFVMSGLFAVVTIISTATTGAVNLPHQQALGTGLLKVGYLLVFYLGKMVWPVNLSSVYELPNPMSLTQPVVLFSVVLTGLIAAVLVFSLRWTRAALTGSVFFVIAISPTLGLVSYSWVSASDKYVYFPSVGPLLALAAFMTWIWNVTRERDWGIVRSCGILTVVLLICVAESLQTRRCLGHWRDSETLTRYMLTLTPRSGHLHVQLGGVLKARGDMDGAFSQYVEAVQLDPLLPSAHNNVGAVLAERGEFEPALVHYADALRLDATHARAHSNMGAALAELGRLDDALQHFARASELKPFDPDAHYNYGKALAAQGRIDAAAGQYRQALRLTPNNAQILFDWANGCARDGRFDEAVAHYQEALRIKPDYPDAHNNLGIALSRIGKFDAAVAQYLEALRLRPSYADAHYNLAFELEREGKSDQAIQGYLNALRFRPDWIAPHARLGGLLERAGKLSEAILEYEEALRLNPGDTSLYKELEKIRSRTTQSAPS